MNFFENHRPDMPAPLPTGPDMSGHWLSVPEAVTYCAEKGLSRDIKTVRRWAQRSHAHPENADVLVRAQDTENGFRYMIEETSLDRKITQELDFEANRRNTEMSAPAHTAPDLSGQSQNEKTTKTLDPAGEDMSAPVRTEPDAHVRRLEVASVDEPFLKDQIEAKDRQITELNRQLERRDEQIMTMLERDRETNYLINGLQEALSQSIGIESPTRRQLRVRRAGDSPARIDLDDAV